MASWTSAIPVIGDGRVSVDCASFDGLLLGADGKSKFFEIKSISYGIEKSEWGVSKLTDAAFKPLIPKAKVQGRGPWRCTSPMGMGPLEGVFMNLTFLNPYLHGGSYPESLSRTWMNEAGFREVSRSRLADGCSLFRGRLPS